ncbi:hypothetical protein BLNAU_12240 [Blattamonas nauphoetae]|uniref:Uncharacterized protein n=1 Tax=Blattamonas nauphoetae TaxID=2049346 RepID=A0ABQ9XN03_9EUKA|nr:hypothetical protein BLNAU_12240 [Blattamonas nauphoetae]
MSTISQVEGDEDEIMSPSKRDQTRSVGVDAVIPFLTCKLCGGLTHIERGRTCPVCGVNLPAKPLQHIRRDAQLQSLADSIQKQIVEYGIPAQSQSHR